MTTENTPSAPPALNVPTFSFNRKPEKDTSSQEVQDDTIYSEWLLGNPAGLPFLLAVVGESSPIPTWKTFLGMSPYKRKLKQARYLLHNEMRVSNLTSQLAPLGYYILNSIPVDLPHSMVSTAVISPTGLIFFLHLLHTEKDDVDMTVEHDYFTHRFHLYDSQIMSILVTLKKTKKSKLKVAYAEHQKVVHIDELIEFIKKSEKRHSEQQLSNQLNNYHETGEIAKHKDTEKGVIKEVRLPSQIYKLLDPETWSDEWEDLSVDRDLLMKEYVKLNKQHRNAKFMRRILAYMGILIVIGAGTYYAVLSGYFDSLISSL